MCAQPGSDGTLDEAVAISGIRAVARGALEAAVEFAAGYPGGPITGIMSGLFAEASPDLHVEWCPNEKDAVAGAFGAALVGRRALAVVKHVGLSVASDAVTAAAFTGIRGAMVIATGADPGGRVSQNEMDERSYAELFMLPMLEPSSPADAVRITRYAFELSERTGAPVLLRVSSAFLRISESIPPQPSPPADDGERSFRFEPTPERTALGRFILDSNRNRQRRLARAAAELENAELATVEGDATADLGIVTCGPYPRGRSRRGPSPPARPRVSSACGRSTRCRIAPSPPSQPRVERVLVVEEIAPYLEERLARFGIGGQRQAERRSARPGSAGRTRRGDRVAAHGRAGRNRDPSVR